MEFITLAEIKKQLRIEPDFTMEDDLLELYGDSAESTILYLCRRTLTEIYDIYGCVPPQIRHAALLLIDTSYQYRSPVSPQHLSIIPYGTVDSLIKPFMKLAD